MSRAGLAFFLPLAVCLLLLPALNASGQDQIPASSAPLPPEDQNRLLDQMREYADAYIDRLPDFICQQTTLQFEAGKKPTRWHQGDTLTVRLVFNQGREHKHLELVNNKPPQGSGRSWRAPLTTEGEFGVLLNKVFAESTNARFSWNRWETLRSQRLAVFDYAVDAAHSTLSLSVSDLRKAICPYHGEVYADPENGSIWRVTSTATDLPRPLKTVSTTIDYSEISIGSKSYLLPAEAKVYMVTESNNIRNELSFQGYRKFEAESTITFGTDQDLKPQP